MAFIEYLLDNYRDSNGFEELCSQVMLKEGYSAIVPVGGTGDRGRDAEETIYTGEEGIRTILFQFSLEKNIPRKVEKTLRRLKETALTGNQLIFVFSTEPKINDAARLKEKALREYGLAIDIRGQRYLALRLGTRAFVDVVTQFFGREISQMKDLYDQGGLFSSESTIPDAEKRCLINLMSYTRHPMAGDVTFEVTRQAIKGVLCRSRGSSLTAEEIKQLVCDYLPVGALRDAALIDREILRMRDEGLLVHEGGGYRLEETECKRSEMALGGIVAGRRALLKSIVDICQVAPDNPKVVSQVHGAVDNFFSALFRKHGIEVAHAILNPEGALETALDAESMDAILSNVVGEWDPVLGNRFREAVRKTILQPNKAQLEYMNALSGSYICMQVMNLDPAGINFQRARAKESVAVLDTDVVLPGIVSGARREHISQMVARMASKYGMACFAFDGTVEEIVFRVKRSIDLYEDLGRPAIIPDDKKQFVSDLFLDIFFEQLQRGEIGSFEEFVADYYDASSPSDHIKQLIEDRMGIGIEHADKYYILPQEEKVERIRSTIQRSRMDALSFKNPVMYRRDALAMVVVEQQNREFLKANALGRWYLVSEDRHILKAYLQNKHSFKVKPSVLPVHFLELLRQCPDGAPDEEGFGGILESEAMLRGAGRNYASIIAALTRLGVRALSLPVDRLTELIDIMDRADFTQWLVRLRSEGEVKDQLAEQIQEALKRVLDESRSRNETITRLEEIKRSVDKDSR